MLHLTCSTESEILKHLSVHMSKEAKKMIQTLVSKVSHFHVLTASEQIALTDVYRIYARKGTQRINFKLTRPKSIRHVSPYIASP